MDITVTVIIVTIIVTINININIMTTLALASLAAYASAAMALWRLWGSLTSFTWLRKHSIFSFEIFGHYCCHHHHHYLNHNHLTIILSYELSNSVFECD